MTFFSEIHWLDKENNDVIEAWFIKKIKELKKEIAVLQKLGVNKLDVKLTKLIDDYLDYLGLEAGAEDLPDQGIVFRNDETYQSVKQLKPALKKSMDVIGASLAKVVEYDVGPEVLSSLTLSYDRYEDITRDKEIVSRNATLILNPCFLPGGKTIKILSE